MIKETLRKMIGHRIKFFRELRGMKQEEFAEKMEYESGSSMISQIETGGTAMSIEKCVKAAQILNVNAAVLLTENDYSDDDLVVLDRFLSLLGNHSSPNLEAIKTLIKAS